MDAVLKNRLYEMGLLGILTFSAYSSKFSNPEGLSDEEIKKLFLDEFFHEVPEYQLLYNKIINRLLVSDGLKPSKPILFLEGYAGSGKSTFINWFKNELVKDNSFKLNVLIESIDKLSQENVREAIDEIIIFHMLKHEDDIEVTLHQLSTLFGKDLKAVSPELNKLVKKHNKLSLEEQLALDYEEYLQKHLDTFGLLSLMMIGTFLGAEWFNKDIQNILIFDNLDALGAEYYKEIFSKRIVDLYARVETFCRNKKVLLKAGYCTNPSSSPCTDSCKESREPKYQESCLNRKFNPGLKKIFKFIFVVRDTTRSVVGSHYRDNALTYYGSEICKFNTLDFIDKRVDFYCDKISEDRDIKKLLKLVTKDDYYFTKVFKTGLNYNHRNLSHFLFHIIESEKELKFSSRYKTLFENEFKYGARGILFYIFISFLQKEDYLKVYSKVEQGFKNNEGWYNPLRVALTILLNLCEFKVNWNTQKSDISSTELEKLMEETASIFDNRKYIELLNTFHMIGLDGYTHLLTIFNEKYADNINGLLKKYPDLLKLKNKDYLSKEEETLLKNTKVKIAPASFIYVRYLAVHFEFYSHLVGNEKPLYMFSFDDDGSCKEATFAIEKVFNRVSYCIDKMRAFYNTSIAHRFNNNVIEYRSSMLSYQHGEVHNDDEYQYKMDPDRAKLHSTRIIHSTYRYIDDFRRSYVCGLDEKTQKDLIIKANNSLVPLIKRFVQILDTVILEPNTDNGYEELLACILYLEQHPYDGKKKIQFTSKEEHI